MEDLGTPDSAYSWIVAIAGSVAMIFTFGTPMSYGILYGPIGDAFGTSGVALSSIFSVMLFAFFIGSGMIGVFATRVPARGVLLVCATATGVIAPSLYFVESLIGLILVFAVLGLALGTAFVLITSIVPRWFEARRGAATGLIFVGNGLGLFLLPPIWQYATAQFGVRRGFLLIMGGTTVAFLLASLVCRRPRWAARSTATVEELIGWVSRLAATRSFQLLFVGIGLAFAWYQLLASYAVDLFISRGVAEATASAMFGLIGGVSIISRIGSGYIADVVGSRQAFITSLVCAAAGICMLFAPLISMLLGGIFLIGLGLGGSATLYVPVLMSVYNPEKDTAVIGLFNIAGGIGSLAMPPLGTASVVYTDGYTVAILLTLLIALAAVWAIYSGMNRS